MSSNLYWEPIKPISTSRSIGTGLKLILRDAWGDLNALMFDSDDIGFFRGVMVSSANEEVKRDAKKIIVALEKNASIIFREDFG